MARFTYSWYKTNKRLRLQAIQANRMQRRAERTFSLPQGASRNQTTYPEDNASYTSEAPPTYEQLMDIEKETENYEFPVEVQ